MSRKTLALGLLLILFTPACYYNSESGSNAAFGMLDVNSYPINKLVCDPLTEDVAQNIGNQGLKAELYYLKENQEHFTHVSDYINFGSKANQFLFFSNLNVPTRLFDLGFPTETGGKVKSDSGEELLEWFALRFSSILKLTPDQEDGTYELALLSDDGAILRVRNLLGEYVTIVENDDLHPTRFGCGETLEFDKEQEYVIQLDYFQGPKYHISVIPMWRKVSSQTIKDPLCGAQGNSKFFDYNNSSAPQQAYKDLLNRGWKPIAQQNWELPLTAGPNPCQNEKPPIISNIELLQEGVSIFVNWNTNREATSQLLITDLQSGEEILTKSDMILRTQHSVSYDQLLPGNKYKIQAISISGTYGKTVSRSYELSVP